MYCRICGDESSVEYRDRSRMFLCASCHADTPRKATREEFDRVYWGQGPEADSVPEGTKRDFFEDYKASRYCSVETYHDATGRALHW
jgi:hypothetical protein